MPIERFSLLTVFAMSICLSTSKLISLCPFPYSCQSLQAQNTYITHSWAPHSLLRICTSPPLTSSPNYWNPLLCLWISQSMMNKISQNSTTSLNFSFILTEPWLSMKITVPYLMALDPEVGRSLLVPHCSFLDRSPFFFSKFAYH